MKPEHIPLLSAFVGTVLGALVSLASVWMQQRAQEKRDRGKFALDAAIKEYESAEKYAAFMAEQGERIVTLDLGYYIVLHTKLAAAISSGSDITKESWIAAHRQAIEISEAGVEFHKQRRATRSKQSSVAP